MVRVLELTNNYLIQGFGNGGVKVWKTDKEEHNVWRLETELIKLNVENYELIKRRD